MLNIHIEHLEDLIFDPSQNGRQVVYYLKQLSKLLSHQDSTVQIALKIDGSPSIVCGTNGGRFFVGTKSVFNKKPKINYTTDDIASNHPDNPQLQKILTIALRENKSLQLSSIVQADVMYTSEDLGTQWIEGQKYIIFTPNLITYAVPFDSDFGRQIYHSKIGLCFHTAYEGSELSNLSISEQFPSIQKSNNVCTFSTKVHLTRFDELDTCLERISHFQKCNEYPYALYNSSDANNMIVLNWLKSFENFCLRYDIYKSHRKYVQMVWGYVNSSYKNKQNQLKTIKARQRVEEEKRIVLAKIIEHKSEISELQYDFRMIQSIKDLLLSHLYKGVDLQTFLQIDGQYVPFVQEGFVVKDSKTRQLIKLVDRQKFSRKNFERYQNEKFSTINGRV